MYIKLIVGARTKSGLLDQRGEVGSCRISNRCKAPLTITCAATAANVNGCQRPNGEQSLQPPLAMAPLRRQGGHGHRCFLCPRSRLLSWPRQSRLQHHHRCSPDPSPQLSLYHEINHSSLALTLLQAITPPSEPSLCNLTTPSMVPSLTRPFRFWY